MKTRNLLLFATAAFIFSSCVKDQVEQTIRNYTPEEYAILKASLDLPEDMHDYSITLPRHLGGSPTFVNNHQATLGRVLFYDKNLSSNGQVSCASCHKAEKAFGDDVAFSQGVITERTSRNSLSLGAFSSFSDHYSGGSSGSRLFWDERAGSVVEQSRQSFLNPVEMGVEHLSDLVEKVNKQPYYDVLFRKAFPKSGADAINFGFSNSKEDQILIAIEAFVNSLGSANTKFDQQMNILPDEHATFSGFTAEENLGKQLFVNNCSDCHNMGPNFHQNFTVANNGLDMEYADQGVGAITGKTTDRGVFKAPMLRNIALSAPYMHDGRFATLEEVVEHYSSGIKNHPNLHGILKVDSQPKHLNLSPQEKEALVAFLHTLTDMESLMQERFADPFK